MSRIRIRPIYVFAAIVAVVVLVILLQGWLSSWFAGPEFDDLSDPGKKLEARDAARERLIQLFASIGAIGALVFTALSYRLSREKQDTDSYAQAIDQIGSESPDSRVGGIYALGRIMRTSPSDHGSVVDVLTAFLRERAPSAKGTPIAGPSGKPPRPSSDVQAALTVLALRPVRPAAERDPLRLSELVLDRARLRRAKLTCARLRSSRLRHAHLEEASLEGAICDGADFSDAHLEAANLNHASLRDAKLRGAKLASASMTGAHLAGAKDADLSFDQLRQAHCQPDQSDCASTLPTGHRCHQYEL